MAALGLYGWFCHALKVTLERWIGTIAASVTTADIAAADLLLLKLLPALVSFRKQRTILTLLTEAVACSAVGASGLVEVKSLLLAVRKQRVFTVALATLAAMLLIFQPECSGFCCLFRLSSVDCYDYLHVFCFVSQF